MILVLARHALRECFRRPFPYVAAVAIVLLTLASRLFLAFSFGAADMETTHLAVSALFLMGFVHAAFQGTGLVRTDLEGGTLGLLLTKPVTLESYVLGRFLGLAATGVVLCAAVAAAVAGMLLLFGELPGAVWAGWSRALLPILVLQAAALFVSSIAPRVAAPVLLITLFVAGSLPGVALLPSFAVFGLEATAAPSTGLLCAYAGIYASIFLLLTYIVLASKAPLRSQS